jgi:hypothetical protein
MNSHRNEVAFKVGAKSYTIRPTLEALDEFETDFLDETSSILAAIRQNASDPAYKPAKVAGLFKCVGWMMSKSDTAITKEQGAEEAYQSLNYIECLTIVTNFNVAAYYGGVDVKAAGAKKPTKGK